MAGVGKRFVEAGYSDPKPLIDVEGFPIIKHVLDMFPNETNVTFICNDLHLRETNMRSVLQDLVPTCRIFEVPVNTKRGPVEVVASIFQEISEDEEVIVSYCDYGTKWNYQGFLDRTRNLDSDGALICYRGFHPHMLGTDHYAYVKNDGEFALEVSEKKPFTENKMSEYASNGAYYFKNGQILKKYFQTLLDSGNTIKGEFYVSMVYNQMIRDGLRVSIFEIEKMLQWGTPYDLEIYKRWSSYFNRKQDGLSIIQSETTLILPMAGRGIRFANEGYSTPKPLLPVDGKPMIVRAVDCLPKCGNNVFVMLKDHEDLYGLTPILQSEFQNTQVVTIDDVTEGQASTCAVGILSANIDLESPILISACDNGVQFDALKYSKLVMDPSIDVIVWTFRNNPTSKNNPNMYSWVDIYENNRIKSVSCKKFPFDNPLKHHAIIGTMFFKKARYFMSGLAHNYNKNIRTNNEFYVDDVINANLSMGLRAAVFEVDNYICWGTPDDYRTYLYWHEFFRPKTI